ncbi:MAG: hypothetical protein ACRELA_23275 [Candidatus Rokuibacteriota bacterium]
MRFGYYDRLSRPEQRIYRKSDDVTSLRLTGAAALRPLIAPLARALGAEDRAQVEAAAQRLHQELTRAFGVSPCRVEVLSARPHGQWGELQGLYTPGGKGRRPKVTLWMRTARQKRLVAFRTFLRTLLHELGHHLDYEYLRLADSFHTEGFYKRESSLFHQLVPALGPDERSTAPEPSAVE